MAYVDRLLTLLDRWRHLPSYQLERRADIFFAMYLPEIASKHLKLEAGAIIPEFPIRIATIDKQSRTNRSFKIDYLIRARRGNKVAFVELKTDMRSKRPEQEAYLKAAKDAGMVELLEGLKLIVQATTRKAKYRALIDELATAKFVQGSGQQPFSIVERSYQIQIAYIQPQPEKLSYAKVISFDQVARIAQRKRDGFGKRFATSLEAWSEEAAGAQHGAA